jgi:hypothetical protein
MRGFLKIMVWGAAIWGASLIWLDIIRYFLSPLIFGLLVGTVLAYLLGQYLGHRDRSHQVRFSSLSSSPTRPAPSLQIDNHVAEATRPSSVTAVRGTASRSTRPAAATQ